MAATISSPEQRSHWPVCGHAVPDAVLAWSEAGAITAAQWLVDAQKLAGALPAGCTHVLNLCQDRYLFLAGFGAGMLTGSISLQPSSLAPAALAQLLQHAPAALCLHDGQSPALPDVARLMPLLDIRQALAAQPGQPAASQPHAMPQIASDQVVAQVFTSGSTGLPVAHAKTWGKLCRNALAEAQRLDLAAQPGQMVLIGTVPSQHMYGFESVLLLALVAGCSLWAGRPFYPADVAQALAGTPAPRMLVTTPVHLRALVDADVAYPAVARLLCATAPLAVPMAQQAETRFAAPLHEIYGSTETSQIAVRRTLDGAAWWLFPDVVLEQCGDTAWVSGGHVEGRVPLSDLVEPVDASHFVLHGRKTDMVNIAGRRSSLAYLNHQLALVPGVQDGAFFVPHTGDTSHHEIKRTCLIACAPGMTPRQVLEGLRLHIESVFLPRPVILVERMPRNDTGKLPLQALQDVYDAHLVARTAAATPAPETAAAPVPIRARWTLPTTHPVFDGHFPGQPVLPGAMLLQHCVDLWLTACGTAAGTVTIQSAKFLAPCLPGDALECVLTPQPAHTGQPRRIAFAVQRQGSVAASGVLLHSPAVTSAAGAAA